MPTSLKQMPPEELRRLQRLLVHRGANLGASGPQNDGVDGDWGPQTAAAFDAFLKDAAPGVFAPISPKPAPAPPSRLGPNPLSIPALPAKYRWLADMGDDLPRIVWEGLQEYGVKELAGAANSLVILSWAAEVGLKSVYTADSIPWCGLFMALIVRRSGRESVKDPLWALNWAKWGVDAGQPSLGDILIFTREGGGHVAVYVGEDATHYHVLGSNQSDAVNISRIEKKRLYRARRPVYKNPPASVKPYLLDPKGGIVSTNEA